MGSRGRSPGWRDEAAAALLVRYLGGIRPGGPTLVLGDPLPDVADHLCNRGLEVYAWNRRAFDGRRATPWPPDGPFGTAALRLPRAKEELAMTLHGAAGALTPGGTILVYGAKDEGIGSVSRHLGPLFDGVETVAVGGHCRVLRARLRARLEGHRGRLQDWRELGRLEYGSVGQAWVSYPGVFAHGHLDPGTRLLLDALPDIREDGRILDYGCGSGVVAAVVRSRNPQVRLDLLDIDAVALEAARENVPGCRLLLGDGLPSGPGEPFDAILSNPPFHRGKAEEPEMILRLIRGSPPLLAEEGGLVLVAQRRILLESALREAFERVGVRAEGSGFRVWEGWHPR
ncbi:MAG: methyltransferase [Longimicrobiales bacterium]